ncbi:MAG: AAA family ATPase [Cyanobacteria bacterium P01_F01_bin.150]
MALWQHEILDAVGDSGQVLIEVIPELATIIGEQPAVPELVGSAAQHRFNLIFGQFVRIFTTPDHPLVIFLDDLQWADLASLKLLKLLMQASDTGYLLVLGAYRDNEVFSAHPLMLCLEDIRQHGDLVQTLTLTPLRRLDVQQLVADTLRCESIVAQPLAQLIYQKMEGNPFFTTQFLLGLHEEGCIVFDRHAGHWQCDLANVRVLALTDDVVTFMVGRLQKLHEKTQEILTLAACIGNRFFLRTLAMICNDSGQPLGTVQGNGSSTGSSTGQDEIAAALWHVLQEGLVVPESETYKFFQGGNSGFDSSEQISVGDRFLHDRVQQAAYALIPDNQKQSTHYRVGTLLLEHFSESEQEQHLFELVGQLNVGIELIKDWPEQERLAHLNLRAGHKAKTATAYGAATQYFAVGRQLLGEAGWQIPSPFFKAISNMPMII